MYTLEPRTNRDMQGLEAFVEWIIGIYLVIGVLKTLARLGNPNPALKPTWMSIEKNPLKFCLYFTFHSVAWPLARK